MCGSSGGGKNNRFCRTYDSTDDKAVCRHGYRRVIPLSFLCGAVLLTYADIAARMIYQPYEVPIGIFTAMLGVPFFLYMAGKERG